MIVCSFAISKASILSDGRTGANEWMPNVLAKICISYGLAQFNYYLNTFFFMKSAHSKRGGEDTVFMLCIPFTIMWYICCFSAFHG